MNAPPLPKTYATIRWGNDMDPQAADTASDLESLEQDCLHVIMQVLGSNQADPTSGCNAAGLLNGTSDQLTTLCAQIDAQLPEDTRVTNSTSAVVTLDDGSFQVTSTVQCGAQVFTFNFVQGPNGLELST
jgi:hypothetical protein